MDARCAFGLVDGSEVPLQSIRVNDIALVDGCGALLAETYRCNLTGQDVGYYVRSGGPGQAIEVVPACPEHTDEILKPGIERGR